MAVTHRTGSIPVPGSLNSVLMRQLDRRQAIQADSCFRSLYGKVSADLGRNSDHKFAAEFAVGKWLRHGFPRFCHFGDNIRYDSTDSSKRSFDIVLKPPSA